MKHRIRGFLRAVSCLFLLIAAVFNQPVFAQSFAHPGALNTQADFDRIKAKVAAGEWPWYDSYVTLCNDGLTSLNWGWAPVTQIVRGSGGGNNFARSQQDAIAIYLMALRWRISGDTRYADKAIQGMDAWSSTMIYGPTGDNWGLASGLCGYEFAVAGETLRGYSGWSQTSITNYQNFLMVFYSSCNSFLINHGGWDARHIRSNWDLDNMAAIAGIGVFCDNPTIFNQAINYFKNGNGNGQVEKWCWYLFPEGIGQMEESTRDQAHCCDALASMAVLCQIADSQGVDLYGYDYNRFLKGAEYFSKFNLWNNVPWMSYDNCASWPGEIWETNIGWASQGAYLPVFDMLNSHFVKKGMNAPFTAAYAASHRPSGNIGNWNSPDYFGYDTLTHYQDPPTTDQPPSSLGVNFDSRKVTLSWWGSPRASSYNVKRSTVSGGPYTTIATTNASTVSYVDDQLPHGPTYYYVVSAITPSGETANSPEAVGGCVTRYNFEGDASDSVGTFSGTLACSGSSGLPGFTAGHGGGQALLLNGTDQYVQLPLGVMTYHDITIAAWVKWGGGNAWQRIFDSSDPDINRDLFLTVSDGSRMQFFITNGWQANNATLYGPSPALNTWTHVAVTIKGSTATLYENGVPVDTEWVGTQPMFGQAYTYIGKSMHGSDPNFNGAIDDFRIYNCALSGSDLYTLAGQGPNHAPQFASDPITLPQAWDSVPYAGHSIFQLATDFDGGPLTFTKLSGPAWLKVGGNGELSGTPGQADVGIESFNVRVTDAAGATDDATIYITVNNVNQAPTWNSPTLTKPSINQNQPYSYAGATLAADATDLDTAVGDTITFSKVSGPAWLTVASNGALSGTPGAGDVGMNTFTVRVTDASGLHADATLNITVVPYSLRSQFQFEGNFNDSVSSFNGTPSGSPTYVAGRVGQAVSLNGATDFVSLPAGATNYNEMTVAAWVYWNGGSNNQRVFDFGNSTSQYLELCPNTGGGMRFETVNSGTVQQINYATPLAAGRWVHVAITLSGSVGTLYVNGTAVATNTNLTIRPTDFSPQLNYVGKSQWSADPLWNGKIDDFRIYNYALSASDISSLIGSVTPLTPTGFTATGGNGFSRVSLSWSAAVGAASYNVKRATSANGTYTTIYSGSATSFNDTTGTPGVTYYYVVTAVDAGGESTASSAVAQFANGSAPLVYLRMDETSGTTANDSSRNGWNGTLVGGTTWAAGRVNNAVSLSGNSNYVSIPSGVVAGMTNFTISAWIKLNSLSTWARIFDFGTGTSNFMMLTTQSSTAGKMQYSILAGGINQQINSSTIVTPTAVWTHVAVTLSGSVGTLYINGTSAGTNTAMTLNPSSLGTTTQNYIGKSQFNDPYLNGLVDEFQIYPRALSSTEIAALATSISAPSGVSINAGNAQATLTWNSVANATGYNLKRIGTSGGPYTTVQANISGTTCSDTSLVNSVGYYYVVTALNGVAESANSSEVTTTPAGAPPVPTGLQTTATTSLVSLTWTSSYGATSYNILRSTTSGIGYVLSGTSTNASYSDTTVTNGTTYYYVVNAAGPNGQSANSSEASARPLAIPGAPTGLTATGTNAGVILSWSPTLMATTYNVKRTTTSGSNYAVVATTGSTGYVDTGLTNGTTYYYVVSALDSMGEGGNSGEVGAAPVAPPSAPSGYVSAGNAQAGLLWNAASGATSYSVKRSGTSGGPYTVLYSGSATSFFDLSAVNGTTYYYVITASNAGGDTPGTEMTATPANNPLVSYLRFDEQVGTNASDSTGHGWNGTLVGGTNWAAGKINNAVSLSGNSNYTSQPTGLMAGVKDFTISAWVKLNSISTWARIFDFGTGTTNYMFLTPSSGASKMRFAIRTPSISEQQINSSSIVSGTGTWTHVAVTLSGSVGTLYINGVVAGTNSAMTLNPTSLGITNQNYIGKSQFNDPYLNGLVDEFQIYGRALSASEIGTLASPLSAPANLTATAGYSQVTCNWSTVAGATSYNLKRAYISGGPYTTLATLTGTTYTDLTPVPESPYYYVVTSGSGLVESANSAQATATPLMAIPAISSATTASGTNGSAFSYQITATNVPTSFGATGLPTGLILNSASGVISGTPSVSGTFNIATSASNDAGTGNATLTLTLQPPAPVITSGLAKSGTSGSAFSYAITASNTPTSFASNGLPTGLSVNASSGVISGTPSVTGAFAVTISATNGGGTGSATLQILILSGSFGAPTGVAASAGNGAVSLAWNPVVGASTYNVKRTLTSGSNYTTVASGLTSPSYSDSGLTNRTQYYYVVSAVTSGGTESANSSEAGATPMPPLTWVGGGSDAYWQTAANWSSQPVAGNPLSFEGSLQLSNTNNYSANTQFGAITFNSGAGAFSLNGNAINLAGDVVNNSGTAQTINLNLALVGASRTINTASANISLAGVISQSGGTYGLIKSGTGNLTLSGTNTFAGGVVLNSGYLNVESHAALGTGTLTLAGGTLRNLTNPGYARVLSNPLMPQAGLTSFVRAVGTDLVLHGNLIGSGTIDLSGTYNAAALRLSGTNSGFTGTVNISGPNVRLDTPDSGDANAAWVVGISNTGGLQLNASGTTNTFQLGSLSGNGVIEGHFIFNSSQVQTLSVGALGMDSTFSGSIIDNAVNNAAFGNGDGAANNMLALTKVGAETLTLSGSNPYSGPTIVNAGTLKLNGILSGTSAVTVNNGGALAGTGTSSGSVTISSGAAIAPGDSGAGTLTINGALTLNDGSILNVQLSGTGTSDQIILGSGLVTTGTTTLNVAALSGFGQGTYPLITGTAVISAANFTLGTVPAGYACSLSATNGVLSITSILLPLAPTGLSATPGDTTVNLSWNPTATATSYNVKRSTTSGSGYVTIASVTGTSFNDSGLTNGATYYYVVSAVNTGGEGPNSVEASARPLPPVPVISSPATASGTAGSVFSYAITASSSPTSYAATGLPSGLSVNTNTGIINGTPSVTGTFNVTLNATNLGGTGTATLTLTVFPPAPVITSAASATGTNGTAFSYTITATNSPSSFAATGLPAGLSLNTSTGLINGTPTVTGTFSVSLSASNWGGTGTGTLMLTILPPLPVITSAASVTGTAGAPFSYQITATSNPTSFGATVLPTGLAINATNGLISGTPTVTGMFSATLMGSNVTGTGTASLSITLVAGQPVWTGSGADNNWTTAANWTVLPLPGEDLAFTGTTQCANNNNFASGTQFGNVLFNSGAGAFTLGGNAITLSGSIANNSTSTQTINLGMVLAGGNLPISAAGGNLILGGAISGSGGINAIGSGLVALAPVSGTNTYSGPTLVSSGTLEFQGTPAMSGSSALSMSPNATISLRADTSGTFVPAGFSNLSAGNTYNIKVDALTGAGTGKTLSILAPSGGGGGSSTTTLNINSTAGDTLNFTTAFQTNSNSGSAFTSAYNNIFNLDGANVVLNGLSMGNNGDGGITVSSTTGNSLTLNGNVATNTNRTTNATVNSGILILKNTQGGGGTNWGFFVSMNGGVLDVNAPSAINSSAGGGSGNNSLTLISGTLDNTSGAGLTETTNPTIKLNGSFAFSTGTSTSANNLNLGSGSVYLATNSTITANGAATLTLGAISSGGSFSLTKAGTGTLVLTGSSSFAGGMTVSGGILSLNGALGGSGTNTVSSSAAISGTGSIAGPVVVSGTMAPGNGGASTSGTLTVSGPLTFNSGAVLNIRLSGTTNSDAIVAGSSVTASGTTTINLTALSGFGPGTYSLISGTSTLSAANFQVGSAPISYGYALSASNGVLSVTVVAPPTAPSSLTASAGDTVVNLGWTAGSGASSYNVKRALTSGGSYTTIATGVTTLSYSDSTVSNGTTYYYVVSSVNLAGESPNSGEASAMPVPPAPVVTSATSATAPSGSPFSYSITASNSPTSFGASGLPTGLSVNTSTGVISGTPSVAGTFNSNISATNLGGTGTATLVITVLPPPPAITSALTATGTAGASFSYTITASNSPTSFDASGMPAGLNINTSTGLISGTPTTAGTANVTLNASNAGGTGSASLTITVVPPAPSITSGLTSTGTAGFAYNYQITATNSPTSYSITGLPTGLSLNTGTGLISGTPSVTGTFTASVTASNAGGSGSASLVLTIISGMPGVPAGLTAAGSNGVVSLNWSPASLAATYNVKRSQTSGSGYTTVASGVTATSYNDTSVTNWTTYYYVVSAVNSQGESSNSAEASATPMPPDTWIGAGTDNYWQTAANWSTLPVAGDTLYFAGSTRLSDTNNYAANTAFGGMVFNTGAGAFTLAGNAIILQGDLVNNSTNTQILSLGMVLTGSSRAINTASGNITITGPIAESGGSFGLVKTGNNILTLSGSNTFSGGVSHGVGTISVTTSSGSNYGPLGTGTVSLVGGTLNNSGATSTPNLGNPIALSGTLSKIMVTTSQNFQLNGPLLGAGMVSLGGGGNNNSLYLNGTNAMTSGTVVFSNGTNSLRILNPNFGNSALAWVFNNTTANRETLDFTNGTISFGSMTGAGIVQGNNSTGTKTISVGALGYTETFSGVIQNGAGTLALIKTGSGTFTVSGNNSYSGGTAINGGILNVTGALSGAGTLTVNSGGTLAGTGTVAGTTIIANGGAITPGNNGAGTLNLSGLTLNDGANLSMELSGTGSSDKIGVSGAVSLSGTTTINLTALSGFGAGTYPLISGTSALNAANFKVGTAPSGYSYTLNASSGGLSVTVVAPPSAPSGLTATAGNSGVTLAWTASSGATSYNLKRSLTSGGAYTLVASGTATSYTDSGLTNGTAYYYVVSASNAAGEGANSTQASAVPTNNTTLPRFSLSGDIGTTGATGATSLTSGTYTMQGAGADIWGTADAFQFMYQQVSGDCDVRVRVTSVQNTNAWAKAGVMIRNTLDAGSAFADVVVTPSSGVSSQWRQTANGNCGFVQTSGLAAPYWVRLVRSGTNFTAYQSADGATWTNMGATAITMNTTVYVGLAVTSHVAGTLCTATMDNFSVVALPSPWAASDVGIVGSAGSATYSGSTYIIAGSGVDISGTSDAFRYAYQTSTGDCDITARVSDVTVTNSSAKAAIMVRESLNANSVQAMVVVTPSSGISVQWRSVTGGSTSTTAGPSVTAPYWTRLVRSGNTFTGYYSADGTNWTAIGSTTLSMASSAYMGLGVTSHSDGVLCTATFDNVTANP